MGLCGLCVKPLNMFGSGLGSICFGFDWGFKQSWVFQTCCHEVWSVFSLSALKG